MSSDRDDGFPVPKSPDFLGTTEDLRRQVQDELRALGGRVPERFEVADPTGAVRLLVRRDGRVEDIDIIRERLAHNGFGAALGAAYVASVRESLTAQALAAFADPDSPAPTAPPAAADPAPRYAELADLSARIRRVADETDRRVEETRKLLSQPMQPEEHTVTSPAGYVRLALRGRRIVTITADEPRIPGAYLSRLRADVLAALRLAQQPDDDR